MVFYTYMLVCSDGSYYTGHTDNLERRVGEHQSGLVSGHTKGRRPVRLVWSQDFVERHEALAAERQIKGWSRAKKEALIDRRWDELSRLSRSQSAPFGWLAKPAAQDRLRQAQGERAIVSESALQAIQTHAAAAAPREACGLLLGAGGRITQAIAARNVHPTPCTHFEIDPQALIDAHRDQRQGGAEVLGYYHSHPSTEPHPSATDIEQAAGDGKIWAIASDKEVRFWTSTTAGFTPLSMTVIER
jgi:predicted GIY-YIG superfamily endonuclease/proteasome lid subunit RPN8/RPN11